MSERPAKKRPTVVGRPVHAASQYATMAGQFEGARGGEAATAASGRRRRKLLTLLVFRATRRRRRLFPASRLHSGVATC